MEAISELYATLQGEQDAGAMEEYIRLANEVSDVKEFQAWLLA